MSNEDLELLKLMRFWLFGTFAIVFAAITGYIGMFTGGDWWLAITAGFQIWGITAAACILWLVGYTAYLKRKSARKTEQAPTGA